MAPWLFHNPITEFRGVWIATVDNIDWPQRGMYTVYSQKAEFIRQLDMHKRNGMNAVIVQVRPLPMHFILPLLNHGANGLPVYRVVRLLLIMILLQFMIEETHKRGMEFHAWLNPYRANFNISTASIATNHITRIHPDWFLTYGGKKYFDPSNIDRHNNMW